MSLPASSRADAPARASAAPLAARWIPLVYPLGIGLSACLLFTLEPMVGQLLLPVLGGAPSVWASTLAFFQIVLLLGYLYAHVSATRFGARGPVLHAVLAAAALLAVVFAPGIRDLRFEGLQPVLQILAILTVAVGLPSFVLCSTTPLLSAWLTDVLAARAAAASGGESWSSGVGGDPYRLYVVSNAGSLVSLLAYPLLVQPLIGLSAQHVVWAIAFGLLVVLLVLAAFARLRARRPSTEIAATGVAMSAEPPAGTAAVPLRRRRVVRWLFLAAVPCGLLSAVTNFITADLISAPMLWVGPLGIYLATFIVAFSPRGRRLVRAATLLAPALATLLWIPFNFAAVWPTVPLLILELLGFAVVAQTLHGALAADRPDSSRLTAFYLVVSAGGVVGGSFVGFVAPVIFPGVWEYPILLVVAILFFPSLDTPRHGGESDAGRGIRAGAFRPFVRGATSRLVPFLTIGLVAALPIALSQADHLVIVIPFLAVGALILLIGAKPRLLAANTAIILVALVALVPKHTIFSERNFFGVVQVTRDDRATVMWHGTTNHGSQWNDPALRREPRSYYWRQGPLGDAMTLAQSRGGQEIAIVGLGSGGMASYERIDDHITFIEIDPAVVRVAEDRALFTFLADAPNPPKVIVGDGRLELARAASSSFDLVILDAFTGDAIPTHLLTVEALRDIVRLLKPDGMLIIHASNRYYDLAPGIAAGAERVGLASMSRELNATPDQASQGITSSQWVIAARSEAQIAPLRAAGWSRIEPAGQPITDDFPDVLRFARLTTWLGR